MRRLVPQDSRASLHANVPSGDPVRNAKALQPLSTNCVREGASTLGWVFPNRKPGHGLRFVRVAAVLLATRDVVYTSL
jgi:hypothetical protein